ncbi:MAG TPA: hypothetical protein PL124_07600 [Candidatus Cloacimonadota bacterium]|nr:hypothetical protein [Candidatus Cloacimonadota bacterium]HPS39258.1 hypothetical protein [Candidatus Cloacimonadota bacterium]
MKAQNVELSKLATRITLLISAVAVLFIMGCTIPGIVIKAPDITVTDPGTTAEAPTGGADAQFVQPEEYFVFDELLGDREWQYVELAKMITPATAETKNQAQFFIINGGQTKWMKYWVKTRIATSADFALGKEVIIFEGSTQNDVYQVPQTNQEARTNSWFQARIVDTSETFRGYVMVSGGYKVALNNMRVAVK